MKTYTKESLIAELHEIREQGWIKSTRPGNDGAVGNTLEDLLGIVENNLPVPNAAEWELKAQRIDTTSLTTLFHMEPSPTALKFVPQILLPNYGWKHQQAGMRYPAGEKSFRQTINARNHSDRGFMVVVDRKRRRIEVSFIASGIDTKHKAWKDAVSKRVGLGQLSPQPYWGFEDLFHKVGAKLHNCFFVRALRKKEAGVEFFHYKEIYMLKQISLEGLISTIEAGEIYVDFDARTGHNHGTKFRIHQARIMNLYQERTKL